MFTRPKFGAYIQRQIVAARKAGRTTGRKKALLKKFDQKPVKLSTRSASASATTMPSGTVMTM